MRLALRNYVGKTVKVFAKLEKYGIGRTQTGNNISVLLKDVKIHTEKSTIKVDHIWLNAMTTIANKDLPEGSMVELIATVRVYFKGKGRKIWDFGLHKPTKVKCVESGYGKTFSETFQESNLGIIV